MNPLPANLSSSVDGVESELRSRSEAPVPNVDVIVATAENENLFLSLISCPTSQPVHTNSR